MKKIFLTVFVLLILLVGGYWYYRRINPKYVPLPPRPEITITIIPGWNLRQVADYLVSKKLATSTEDVYKITGEPAKIYNKPFTTGTVFLASDFTDRPDLVSWEGYLAPETYRVFKDATTEEVIIKFLSQRNNQVDYKEIQAWEKKTGYTWHQLLTMASLLEEEAKSLADKKIVADILWRRLKKGWALQLDSTVHYAIDKTGTVFTTGKEREVNSLWNTYKYPGLPPGPICNPSLESIKAALNPTANNYWYFLSGNDGQMHYAKTLDEHNLNRIKYLK